MMLDEANDRLQNLKITEEHLWGLNSLYLLLDLHKDDFCKILDTVGLDKLLNKRNHYDRLLRAWEDLDAKEKYLKSVARLADLEAERQQLEDYINRYSPLG